MQPLTTRYQDWMALKTNLLWIYEGPVPTGGRGGPKDVPPIRAFERSSIVLAAEYTAVWLLLKGEAEIGFEGRTIRARAGQWLIPWQGIRHQQFSADAELLSVRFQAHWPDGRPLFDSGLGLVFPRTRHPELEAAARALLAQIGARPGEDPRHLGARDCTLDDFVSVKIALLLFVRQFYGVLVGSGLKPLRLGAHDERVLKALSHLDMLPLATRIRETDLAQSVGLGLSQFVRLFRAEIGVTPKKYLEQRRRDTCHRMLVNSAIPLKQLAVELGFSHAPDFSAWFKRIHGVSPREFRLASQHGAHV